MVATEHPVGADAFGERSGEDRGTAVTNDRAEEIRTRWSPPHSRRIGFADAQLIVDAELDIEWLLAERNRLRAALQTIVDGRYVELSCFWCGEGSEEHLTYCPVLLAKRALA
jgi:hypothetical protein